MATNLVKLPERDIWAAISAGKPVARVRRAFFRGLVPLGKPAQWSSGTIRYGVAERNADR